jgi:hypothetical protein
MSCSDEWGCSGGGTDDEVKYEQRLSSESPMLAGAVPLESGKEPNGLEVVPQVRLNSVHLSGEGKSDWMDAQRAAHDSALARSATAFHCAIAAWAARVLTTFGRRLCLKMLRVAFMCKYADLTPARLIQFLALLLVWWVPTVTRHVWRKMDSRAV